MAMGAVRPGPAPTPADNVAVSSADGEALAIRLREIAAGAKAPVDALEPALRTILERTAAAAGALCLFDQRHEFLRLAAEVELSDEGAAGSGSCGAATSRAGTCRSTGCSIAAPI